MVMLCIVLAGFVFLIGYFVWLAVVHKKHVNPKVKAELELAKNKDAIVSLIYAEAHKKQKIVAGCPLLKIVILENLNISPVILKSCLQQLIRDEVVAVNDHSVKLTGFGVKYYKNFIQWRG